MEGKSDIVLVVPYFGQFPNYFDLFLKSCEYNSGIDWLIISDNDCRQYNLPSNVKVKNSSLNQLEELINSKEKLSNIKLNYAYKLCDYRPAYGYIFDDYVKDYKFWGHCDIDLIFGDIRKFLSEDILEKHDKILVNGHLTLYRNCEKMNKAFLLKSPNEITFYDAISKSDPMYFDEIGIVNILKYHSVDQYKSNCFIDILPQYSKFRMSTKTGDQNHANQFFYWKDGKVFKEWIFNGELNKKEYMYIHVQKRKFIDHNINMDISKGFYITPHGFIDIKEKDFMSFYKANWKHLLQHYYKRYKNITPVKIKRKVRKYLSFRNKQ